MNYSACPHERAHLSEFKLYDDCVVLLSVEIAFKIAAIAICVVLVVATIIVNVVHGKAHSNKTVIARWILRLTPLQLALMLLRPLIGALSDLRCVNSLAMSLVTHVSAASCAAVATMFVLFQININEDASIAKDTSCWMVNRLAIVSSMLVLQTTLFVAGPFVTKYSTVAAISAARAFWLPVIVVDFTVIPYFCYLGIKLYARLNAMQHKDTYAELRRKVLISVLSCSALGLTTGAAGVIAVIDAFSFEWCLIDLSWISAILFVGFIYYLLDTSRRD